MLALAGLVSFSFVGTSCGDDDEDEKKEVTVEKVKVTFDTDGGSEVKAIEVEKGKEVSVAAPTKDGFTFKGWATEKGGAVQTSIKPDKDITLYAVWEAAAPVADKVKVTFDTDGGSEVAAIEVEKGGAISVDAPTKEFFTFKGWATTKDGEVVADIKADADITLYAIWEAIEPKILTAGRAADFSIVATFEGIDSTKITKVAVDAGVIDMTNADQKKKVSFTEGKYEATIAPSPLNVGDHKVTFTFTDAAGEEKTLEQTFAITEAQLPPLVDVTGDTEGALIVKASQKLADGWDNQFWIVFDEANAIHTDDKIVVNMKVRAEKEASIGTQVHKAPGEYIHWAAIGNVNFTTEWADFTSGEVTVVSQQDGGFSFAFNLNDFAEANNYYVKDVKFTVNGTEVPTTFTVKDKGTNEIYNAEIGSK